MRGRTSNARTQILESVQAAHRGRLLFVCGVERQGLGKFEFQCFELVSSGLIDVVTLKEPVYLFEPFAQCFGVHNPQEVCGNARMPVCEPIHLYECLKKN